MLSVLLLAASTLASGSAVATPAANAVVNTCEKRIFAEDDWGRYRTCEKMMSERGYRARTLPSPHDGLPSIIYAAISLHGPSPQPSPGLIMTPSTQPLMPTSFQPEVYDLDKARVAKLPLDTPGI